MFSALPTRLSSGVLPGFFLSWYILAMLLPGRCASFSSFTCRGCCVFCCACSCDRLLKVPSMVFDWPRRCPGDVGGEEGIGGVDVRVLPPNSPPKDERSTPSRCMGLLAGPDVACAASAADFEFMVRLVGFGCRCMAAVRASRSSGHGWPSLKTEASVAHAVSGTAAGHQLLVHRVARWEGSRRARRCVCTRGTAPAVSRIRTQTSYGT